MWVSILINYPHFMASYRILYRTWSSIRKHLWTAVALPIVLIGILVYGFLTAHRNPPEMAGLANQSMLTLLFPIAVIVLAWHYTGQSWGIACSFAYLGGVRMDSSERRLIRSGFIAMLVFHILWVLLTKDFHPVLDFLYPGLTGVVTTICRNWLFVFAVTFCLGAAGFVRIARRSNWRTSLRTSVPWLATYTWYLLIYFYPQMFFVLQIAHALQYLICPLRVEMNQFGERTGAGHADVSRHAVYYYIVLVLLGAFAFSGVKHLTAAADPEHQLAGLLAFSINIHHYFIDGVIWKIRDPEVRKSLFGHLMVQP